MATAKSGGERMISICIPTIPADDVIWNSHGSGSLIILQGTLVSLSTILTIEIRCISETDSVGSTDGGAYGGDV